MTEAEAIEIFRQSGAILEGHFILTSGLRSPVFIQKARVFMYPERTEALCRALAKKVQAAGLGPIDLIVSPAVGGLFRDTRWRANLVSQRSGSSARMANFVYAVSKWSTAAARSWSRIS